MLRKQKKSRTYAKQPGWKEIGGQRIYFRSKWEVKFAQWLEFLKSSGVIQKWEYEPKTFWFEGIKRGVCSYKPDFAVTYPDGKTKWYEVKGYMDQRSKTKIDRFHRYFPEEVLEVVDAKWFSNPKRKYSISLGETKWSVIWKGATHVD